MICEENFRTSLSSSGCVIQRSQSNRIDAFALVFYFFLPFDSKDFDQLTTFWLFLTYPSRIECLVGRGTVRKTSSSSSSGVKDTTSAPLLKVSPRGCQANKPGKGEALVANCVLTTRRHKARALIDSLLVYLSLSYCTLCSGKSFIKAQRCIVDRECSQWLEIDRISVERSFRIEDTLLFYAQ